MDIAQERATAQARLETLVAQHNQLQQTVQAVTQQIVETQGVIKWLDARIEPDAPVEPPSQEPAAE